MKALSGPRNSPRPPRAEATPKKLNSDEKKQLASAYDTLVYNFSSRLTERGQKVTRAMEKAFKEYLEKLDPREVMALHADYLNTNTQGSLEAYVDIGRIIDAYLANEAPQMPRKKRSDAPLAPIAESSRPTSEHLSDAEFFATLPKNPARWSAADREAVIDRLEKLKNHLSPQMSALKTATEKTLRNGEQEENALLRQYSALFAEASTVKNAPLNVKLERFAYFSKQLISLGLNEAARKEHQSKTSPYTDAVARLMAAKQMELEDEGSPIPQPVTMDPLSFEGKDLLDIGHRLASGSMSLGVVALEVGTITTMILLLAQEMFGVFITPWGPLHKAILATVTAVLAPVIEYAKGLYFTKPAERKEKDKEKRKPYPERVQHSVGKHLRVGFLAVVAATGVAGASKLSQGLTLEVGVAMGGDSSDLAEQSTAGRVQVEESLARLNEEGPVCEAIEGVSPIVDSMLDVEYGGGNIPGRGGSGDHGIGPALGFKAGLLLGTWREEAWGPLPESGSAREAYERGIAAREALGLRFEGPIGEDGEPTEVNLTLEGGLNALWEEFIRATPEATAEDPNPISTLELIASVREKMETLGLRVSQIPDAGRLDEYKWRLATADLWPGKPVIYRLRDDAIEQIEVIQARYAAFRENANELVGGVSAALNEEAERMNRSEGQMNIAFPNIGFDTNLLESIHIDHSVSIRELPEAHARAAEEITGGTGWLNILASSFLLYGIASIGVAGIAYGKGRMNRKRYMDFVERFRESYPVTTENKNGYLDKLSAKMTEGMQALFTSEVGFFGKPVMQQLTALLGDKPWARIDEEMLQVAIAEVMSELTEVEALDAMEAFDGIVHMYAEGFADIVSRGNPEELKALNAAHRLLNSQTEFSRRLIDKLFPGFFGLAAFLEAKAKNGEDKVPTRKEAMQFDGELYGVVLKHLERRVRIEKTKLSWCTQAFAEFKKDKTFEKLGIGSLTEEPNEANISLKACSSFAETPLKPEKLAGSALRQAAIRTLKGKMEAAKAGILEIEEMLESLDESLAVKAGKLNAMDDGIYKEIDRLKEEVRKAREFAPHAEDDISQLSPEGKISSGLADAAVAEIASRMGTTIEAIRETESPEQLHSRIEEQFNTLIRVANTRWSWDTMRNDSDVRKQSISNGQYDMRAEFVVNPADQDTPAASYGVKFTIEYKGSGAEDPPEGVVDISYSLSSSFSEQKTPAAILNFFRHHLDDRGNYYAAKVLAHRIRKGLAKERDYDRPRTQKPFDLASKKVGPNLSSYENFLIYDSVQRHRDSLRGRLEARLAFMPSTPDADVSGTKLVASDATGAWESIDRELKQLCDEVESLKHPAPAAPFTKPQMAAIIKGLTGSDYVRRERTKVLFDHDKGTITVTNPGILGIGKKSAEVAISSFKSTFENQQGNIDQTIRALLAKEASQKNSTGKRNAA